MGGIGNSCFCVGNEAAGSRREVLVTPVSV